MAKHQSVRKRSQKVGLPPGTLVYIGDQTDETFEITTVTYNEQDYHETVSTLFKECPVISQDASTVTWINVNGINNAKNLEELGACFHLHPLVLEDILNTEQRPKLDDYGDYLFVVLNMLHLQDGRRTSPPSRLASSSAMTMSSPFTKPTIMSSRLSGKGCRPPKAVSAGVGPITWLMPCWTLVWTNISSF